MCLGYEFEKYFFAAYDPVHPDVVFTKNAKVFG
jgi:hypothetical protein